jgi:CheY-like chemotaxis protein
MSEKRVLVVDDEKLNLRLFREFLLNRGYRVTIVDNSGDVLKTVSRENPGAIIMDIIMPGQNGDQIAAKLKEDPATRHIPIILITADILKSSDNLPADYFIRRPVIGDDLLHILAGIFA